MDLIKLFTMVVTTTCVASRSSQQTSLHRIHSYTTSSSMTLSNDEFVMPIEIKIMANTLYQFLISANEPRPCKKFFWKSRTICRS